MVDWILFCAYGEAKHHAGTELLTYNIQEAERSIQEVPKVKDMIPVTYFLQSYHTSY